MSLVNPASNSGRQDVVLQDMLLPRPLRESVGAYRYWITAQNAAGTGQVVQLSCSAQSAVRSANFSRNRAGLSGGAVYLNAARVCTAQRIAQCMFSHIVSRSAIALQGECRALLEMTNLTSNQALNGGAIFVSNSSCVMVSAARAFLYEHGHCRAAARAVTSLSLLQLLSTVFASNHGVSGGAVAMETVQNVTARNVTAHGNLATCGGVMLLDDCTNVRVSWTTAMSATSQSTGCALTLCCSVQQMSFSNFTSNLAETGGVLAVQKYTQVALSNLVIQVGYRLQHSTRPHPSEVH